MSGDDAASLVWALLCLVLVGSALAARRLPLGETLRMAAAWLLIFAAATIAFSFRADFAALGRRVVADPAAGETVGGTLRVPMAEDGHYWVKGEVNGVAVRFLVDSGATTTALSSATAAAAKVTRVGSFPVAISTANGLVRAERARIDRLVVGPIRTTDLSAVTAPEFGTLDVLGMNFLSSLKRWGVEQHTLVLEP